MDTSIIELKKTILEDNDKDAERLREETGKEHFSYLNVMSSPGAGKTSTILAVLRVLGDRLRCGVMEADIDSAVDADTIRTAGYPCVQLHTGGMCHLDAQMSRQGIAALQRELERECIKVQGADSDAGKVRMDLVILENVGNLVCPAEFDTGADLNLVILSVPEGDDKPLKYPLMFEKADVIVLNKTDALPAFDFDMKQFEKYVRLRNQHAPIYPVSAKTGEGIAELVDRIAEHVKGRTKGEENNGSARD